MQENRKKKKKKKKKTGISENRLEGKHVIMSNCITASCHVRSFNLVIISSIIPGYVSDSRLKSGVWDDIILIFFRTQQMKEVRAWTIEVMQVYPHTHTHTHTYTHTHCISFRKCSFNIIVNHFLACGETEGRMLCLAESIVLKNHHNYCKITLNHTYYQDHFRK